MRPSPLVIQQTLIWFSAISFIFFGIGCFVAPVMEQEFARYGLARFRKIVGILQLAGAGGLLVGVISFPGLGQLAASGLSILMFLGVCVRIKIKDTLIQTIPAFAYMLLNAYLAITGF